MNRIEFKEINVLFGTSLNHVFATAETKELVTEPDAEKAENMEKTLEGESTQPAEVEKPVEGEEVKTEAPGEEKKEEKFEEKSVEEPVPEESMEKVPTTEGGATTGEAAVMNEMPALSEEEISNMEIGGGMGMPQAKPSIMQSAGSVIGITSGVLALGILAGIGLAKLRIKKGINLYED